LTRDVGDVIAEFVASAICSRFGLDLSLHSGDGVAGWGHPQGRYPKPSPQMRSVQTGC
jgi:hypothetical protein